MGEIRKFEQAGQQKKAEERRRQLAEVLRSRENGGAGKTVDGPRVITEEKVAEAAALLERYRRGKQCLEQRIVDNEEWYRQQHWSNRRSPGDTVFIPASGWVFNALANKHADLMDNMPECTCLPQEPDDAETAETLTGVLPVVLEQADFEKCFSDAAWNKIKTGTAVYGVFWNPRKHNGLGDIDIKVIDILNLFWEPGITDIQKSRNLFSVELCANEVLESRYPQLTGKLGNPGIDVCRYVYDDTVDTSDKSAVVDWYYKKNIGGRDVLCYVKFVNNTVLYSSEDDPAAAQSGFYTHGKYPFVVDTLFPEVGTFAGFGYIDIMKDNAITIDRLNAVIVRNAEQGAMRRYFVRSGAALNEEEFADWTKPFIHITDGNLGADNMREYTPVDLSGAYVNVLQAKIDELKEVSFNRDFSQGSAVGGVTSGVAITALQEAGSKNSRDMVKGTYRAYSEICKMMIELMRQFYTSPRMFRIAGARHNGFAAFDNSGIVPRRQNDPYDLGLGNRLPVFDIKVRAHKANPFSRYNQNQDAINYFGMGFFNPAVADQALAALEMMDVEGKERLVERLTENARRYKGEKENAV